MRKFILGLAIIFSSVVLVGCGPKLTSDSFNDLGKGMSANEVIELLGNPSETINKQTEVTKLVDKEIETSSTVLAFTDENEYPDEYQTIYNSALEIANIKVLLNKNESVKALIYKYSYKNSDGKSSTGERKLYFYKDKLSYY
ncbi:hypothetical protein IGI37_000056 [Enterococcus sp. AZ194]|uniref:hypothetical protein n=1 Tax=Enterococcus sp. AZ194 TaxID=2774629 RepID=UPI003F1E5A5B